MMPFGVGVLHGMANLHEQFEARARVDILRVAVFRDRHAAHQLHHKVWPTCVGGAGVEDLGNAGMIHHGQRLPLGSESREHFLGVHARLDDLQRYPTLDRLTLVGDIDNAHAALADLLPQLVGPDAMADFFDRRGRAGRILCHLGAR